MDKKEYYRDPEVARQYEPLRFSSPGGRLTHERELAAIRACFAPSERLLELACGTGRLLRALHGDGRPVVGVDQSPEMAAAGGAGPRIEIGDVFKLPFEDGAFDGAYCFRFTNHYADLRPFLRECARVLKPGGRLLFDAMRWSLLRWDLRRWGGANYPVSDARLTSWLAAEGFAVVRRGPLFAVGPYLIGSLPGPLARGVLTLGDRLPESLQAVSLWHVRKA